MNPELFDYLRELRVNNNREWFQANKKRYDALRADFIRDVSRLIDRIAAFDPEIASLDARSCIYRIYRDLRFSPDKTPYKTYFSAYMAGFGGRTSSYGGYYIHLEPDASQLAGGVWCPTSPMLKQLRRDISDNMDELITILHAPAFRRTFGTFTGEQLTRMPQGFPADMPHGELLRFKSFVVTSVKPESFFTSPDWLDRATEDFRLLHPLNRFLNYTIGQFFGKEP